MFKKGKIYSLAFAACLLAGFLLSAEAEASTSHNVRGRAYTPLYGLVSFNCLDDDFAGTFPFTLPFAFHIGPCELSDHGVNIDNNNNFSGQAWNPVLGYIDFGGSSVPDGYAFNSNCQHQ